MTPDARVEIDAMLASLIDCWNRHDIPAYTSFWLEDCDFVNVIGTHHHSRGKLQAELEWLHGGRFRNSQIRRLEHSIRFLSPDLAIIHMRWHMDGDPGMPGHPSDDGVRRGIFTHVAQRISKGGWRFVASQNTDVVSVPAIPDQPA